MMNELSPEELEVLSTKATDLLQSLGLGDAFRFERLSGGRNNRVYRVVGRGHPVILKWYFHHPDDQRDRLVTEWSFYEWAYDCAARFVAQPLAFDPRNRLAVFSFIAGSRLATDVVDSSHVNEALQFIRTLNKYRHWSTSDGFPTASEACFSVQQHIDCVSTRVDRLRGITANSEQHRDASDFVVTKITTALADATAQLRHWAAAEKVDTTAPLNNQHKCVSPSDFGFHNVLIDDTGSLKFYDFEYAGWDDPAKLLCDFYCQPAIPAPRDTWDKFAELTAELAGDTWQERQRQALLFPLYQVKWCCILLNEFLPTAVERRKFSDDKAVDFALQLQKAKRLAEQISFD
jgi:hypothetical protein